MPVKPFTEATSMTNQKTNRELVQAGHALANALSADSPLMEVAKLVSDISTRLDVAVVRGDELQQKLDSLAAGVTWKTGSPCIPEGSNERFWVTHRLKNGSLHVTDLFFFNCPAPKDEDAFCDAEMTTFDGDPYWPEGWHDLCSHPDFDYCYQKSDLDVLAYAEFIKPEPAKDGE
ncbi:hypothetical protein [Pantoea cypripedii]|uniref:Uncharacterized protein n=1 Tax=Pantoea cypripedii TaxID=55209 RepID=A0A1X1ESX7_PANCY|nr:hypothetical protein [Pantoea cypripedii]ORM93120.1 hypothetical protein HA50_07085 [Pantoea cypripedii]